MKWLRRGVVTLLALVLLAGIALWLYARQTLPLTEGRLALQGPLAEVRIERDEHGVPAIHAASRDDAFFGLGFVHAQDRLWQLETHKRIGGGRLAQAFGPAALDNDRFLRALGVRRAAAAQWALMQGEARSAVMAYTAGINAYLSQSMKARPPEFVVLGLTPEPWTPEDTMAWTIMMAWDLGANWNNELLRMRLALQLPVARIDELLPPYPGEQPLATADYAALFRDLKVDGKLGQQTQAAAPPSGVEGAGSNNWVLSGARTASGQPLLANDPHLKLTTPALWYFARLHAPGFEVAGATMPGLPFVVLGQNRDIAWGFTNTAPDVQDVYLERLDPDDPMQYQTPEGWARFETFDEVIQVKGAEDVRFVARLSRHGPVISDAGVAEGLTGPAVKPAYALAMRWTALDADPGALVAGLGMNSASSVDEFVAVAQGNTAPMQNMVVADRAGRIGMVAAGRVPLRKPENDLRGKVPAPGWDARYDWAGFLDPTQTPREFDPPRGYIATANQRIHGTDYPHYITSEWTVPYRQQRIEQLLEAKPTHDMASLEAIQADIVSLATQRLLPFIQRAQSTHALAAAAQQELQSFDGTMAAERAAPLIFYAWSRQLTEGVLADEVGDKLWLQSLGNRSYRDALERVLESDDGWWCDDKSTPEVETCVRQIDAAFDRALDELQAVHGRDVAAWQWGAAHMARSEHRPFSNVKLLARFFELRSPVGGDTFTVNVSRVTLRPNRSTGELYLDEHGPSLRAIYDIGDPANSRFMHSTGQSGIVFSPLYRSFVEPWTKVDYVPVWGRQARQTLVLQPAASGG